MADEENNENVGNKKNGKRSNIIIGCGLMIVLLLATIFGWQFIQGAFAEPSVSSFDVQNSVTPLATKPLEKSTEEDTSFLRNPADGEHPLAPAIEYAENRLATIDDDIVDYTAILTKRERINGKVLPEQQMLVKVRHAQPDKEIPFSVYLKFLSKAEKDREVIWIQGRNDDKLVAHEGGFARRLGSQNLDPEGWLAMRGQLYPIHMIGLKNLIDKMIERGQRDLEHDDIVVVDRNDVELAGRTCNLIEIRHETEDDRFDFYLARIYVDQEHNIPTRYVSYTWPKEGEELSPKDVLEEYTYTDIQLNVGLTDDDFDKENSEYDFP